jgi:periodic tryptophan protein 2
LPVTYLEPVLRFLGVQLEKSPHVEFHLVWISFNRRAITSALR